MLATWAELAELRVFQHSMLLSLRPSATQLRRAERPMYVCTRALGATELLAECVYARRLDLGFA